MNGSDTAQDQAHSARERPQCIIVAGPNGAGKTTTALAWAGEWHGIPRIVNPDEIAGGLSGAPELGALEAGKLALKAQSRYVDHRQDFAMETTLSGRRWPRFLDTLESANYQVTVYFLWVSDPAACIARVRTRVMKGGHGVSEEEIRRRYDSGLLNLHDVFVRRVDAWHVVNANDVPDARMHVIAQGGCGIEPKIFDATAWAEILRSRDAAMTRRRPLPLPPQQP